MIYMKRLRLLTLLTLLLCGCKSHGRELIEKYDYVSYWYDDSTQMVMVTDRFYEHQWKVSIEDTRLIKCDNGGLTATLYIYTDGYLLVIYYHKAL